MRKPSPCPACEARRKAMASMAKKLMTPVKGAYGKWITLKPKGRSK
jgi:hypothetical protein